MVLRGWVQQRPSVDECAARILLPDSRANPYRRKSTKPARSAACMARSESSSRWTGAGARHQMFQLKKMDVYRLARSCGRSTRFSSASTARDRGIRGSNQTRSKSAVLNPRTMTPSRDVRLLSRACAIFLNAIATSMVIVAAVARSTKYPSSKKPCRTLARERSRVRRGCGW